MNNHTETTNSTFTVGEIVTARSVCDYDCVWTFEVVKRTAKFVTLEDIATGETNRVGVKVDSFDEGREWALPFGSYSMAPVVRAGRCDVDEVTVRVKRRQADACRSWSVDDSGEWVLA